MRKNLSSLLQRGNLKPKERVLLLVANQVSKERDGKSILTEADEHALSEGWTPANNDEVREYNRYHEGWRLTGFAELDAQTTFLTAVNNLLRVARLIDFLFAKFYAKGVKDLDLEEGFIYFKVAKEIADITDKEALDFILKNSGLELDDVIHTYTFESLSEDLKKDILALDPDAKTESQYLDQEEIIADLFDGKDKLTKEAKEKLADLIIDILYNEYFKEWLWSSYFAELPALDILKKWADYNENYTEKEVEELEKKGDEAVEKELTQRLKIYAEKNKKDIRDLLKETILKWLDEGLFIKEYQPIFDSDEKKTCQGETKLPHKEVFEKWQLVKLNTKLKIQELIDKGELKVETKIRAGLYGLDKEDIFGTHRTIKIIIGESLYNLKGDYTFAKDFKKQIDVFKDFGVLLLFLRKCRFLKDYAILLAFKELFKKLSKVYEIDLTYKINKWIESFKEEIKDLNHRLILIEQRIEEAVFHKYNITFLKETFIGDMLIDLEKVEPNDDRRFNDDKRIRPKEIPLKEVGLAVAGIDRYYQEFKKLFDEEF